MTITVADIARHLRGEVLGDASVVLTGFAPAEKAGTGDLTFAENESYFQQAERSAASAILVDGRFSASAKVLIRVSNPRVAFAKVLPLFFPPPQFKPAVHPSSVIAGSARVDPTAYIGPLCSVGEGVVIGPASVLESGVHIGPDCQLGAGVHLHPNVTLYARTRLGQRVIIHAGSVIGSDGFGYVFDEDQHHKVPQVGNVVIGDDVEIGANVTIDRGALGSTVIGRGSKIDNLVQIAHNVHLGEHCVLVSQVGVAGSTHLGNHVILGGQVGIAGHLQLGDKVTVIGQSGVMHDIPAGEKWFGSPAQPDRVTKRQLIALQQLPELIRRVRALEAELEGARKAREGDQKG